MKSLEKDRTQRYETVNALAIDLTHYLKDEPVSVTAPTLSYQLKKFYSRHLRLVKMAAAVSTLLILATITSTYMAVRAEYLKRAAEHARSEEASAKQEAHNQLHKALVGQAEAWLKGQDEDSHTKVWNNLKQAQESEVSDADIPKMRSIAWASLARPSYRIWENRDNLVPDGENLTAVAHSQTAFGFGYSNGRIRIVSFRDGTILNQFEADNSSAIKALTYHEGEKVWISLTASNELSLWKDDISNSPPLRLPFEKKASTNSNLELLPTNDGLILFSYEDSNLWRWNSLQDTEPESINLPFRIRPTPREKGDTWLKNIPIAISPNGQQLVVYQSERREGLGSILVWDLDSQRLAQELDAGPKVVGKIPEGLRFSRNGSHLAFGLGATISLFDTSSWELLTRRKGTAGAFASRYFDLSPEGNWVSFGVTQKHIMDARGRSAAVKPITGRGVPRFSYDNQTLLNLFVGGVPQKWGATANTIGQSPAYSIDNNFDYNPFGAAFSHDSSHLAVSSYNGLRIKDLETNQTSDLDLSPFNSLVLLEDPAFSPDNRVLAAPFTLSINSDEGGVGFWNSETGELIDTITLGDRAGFVSFNKDRPLFAAVSGHNLGVWTYSISESPEGLIEGMTKTLVSSRTLAGISSWIDFDNDAENLFWVESQSGDRNATLHALDLGTEKLRDFKKDVSSGFNSAAVIPNSNYIALQASTEINGEYYSHVEVWDYEKNQLISTHKEAFEAAPFLSCGLAVAPKGQYVAFASRNKHETKIADWKSGQLVASIPSLTGGELWLHCWSPDGNHLVVLGSSGQIETWNISEVRARLSELDLDWED